MKHFIEFLPPVLGIDGAFNTFRMGSFYFKRLSVGDIVLLVNGKERAVIGDALVEGIHYAPLGELITLYAHSNHAMLDYEGDKQFALYGLIQRIYGPHIATLIKKATVIELRRV